MLTFLKTVYSTASVKFWQYAGVVALVVGLLFSTYRAGQRAAQVNQTEQTLEQVQIKVQVDEEVSRYSPTTRRDRLSEWMPDD